MRSFTADNSGDEMLYRGGMGTKHFTWELLEDEEKERSVRGPRERRMGIINYHNYHKEVVFSTYFTCRLTRDSRFGSSTSYRREGRPKCPQARTDTNCQHAISGFPYCHFTLSVNSNGGSVAIPVSIFKSFLACMNVNNAFEIKAKVLTEL